MFTPKAAFSGFSVDDLEAAKHFYADTLGVEVETNAMGMLNLVFGDTRVLIYPKDNHEPASYTVLNFAVDDVDAAVAALAEVGVTMEHYDGMPQGENGVMKGHGPDIAWFTDPAGNVLSVLKDE